MQMYDVIPYEGKVISIDRGGNRMINVTEMFKASGAPKHKHPYEWIKLEQTQELITTIEEQKTRTDILPLYPGSISVLIETREGRNGGTWYCEELALAYAMYLSPQLHLACLRFILDKSREPVQSITREDVYRIAQEVAAQAQRIQPVQQEWKRIPSAKSDEAVNWGGFITDWWSTFGSQPVKARDLIPSMERNVNNPFIFINKGQSAKAMAVVNRLMRHVGDKWQVDGCKLEVVGAPGRWGADFMLKQIGA